MNSTLNNNEVRDNTGTAVVFNRVSTNGKSSEYQIASEPPNAPKRISIKHAETGSGFARRRRSVLRADFTRTSTVDATKMTTTSAYVVLDAPVGAHTSTGDYASALSYIIALLANTGAANTTIVYNGTATGAVALLNGEV
jgi:hypothetical protein